ALEKSHRDKYVDADGTPRTDKSQKGHLSVGVPGTIAGIMEMYKYASLHFHELIQPAIDLAEKGFCISEREAASLNSIHDDLKEHNSVMPVFVKETPWKKGDTLIQKDLAVTLKRIQKD